MERLTVRTRSIPTAAALCLLTGETPRILTHHDGAAMFEFSPDVEPMLTQFLQTKARLDRAVEAVR
jgi:hypothetical protein